MADETNVGSVYLQLGLDTSQWTQQLSRATRDINRQFSDINSNFVQQINNAGNNGTRQISGFLESISKKFKLFAGTAAVGSFIKSCLDVGSDITEVQNVVDTAFKSMSSEADKFAQDAITNFGLSELSAKKYMGVFGQMSSAMGITGRDALEMSKNVTALTGDVASFYNLSTDEAYTKMKSIWTGETETLKDLGVVMTQTNLDNYALANGFGKTTAKMTEQEKVMLRYQYVTSALSNASGDFAKTQDSWANQTRILSLRFEQLKASLGKGFIALFTPIVKGANVVLAALQKLADGFANFIQMLTGADVSTSMDSMSGISDVIDDIGDNANDTSSDISGIGDTAEKTAKKIERSLMGFDQINKLSDTSDDSGSDAGSGGSGGSGVSSSVTNVANEIEKAGKSLSKFKKLVDELADKFKTGFKAGLGADFEASIERSRQHLENIKNSLIDIFTDPKVTSSAYNFALSFAETLGKLSGAVVSIGMSIGENLLGGLDYYLSNNTEYIKQKLVNIFDVGTELSDTLGNWYVFLAEIAEIFRSDDAKAITGDIVSIFVNGFLEAMEICGKLSRDLTKLIANPLIENKDGIKEVLKNTIAPIREVFDDIAKAFKEVCEYATKTYDEHIKPMFDKLTDGLAKIVGIILDVYNKYVVPVLDRLAQKAKDTVNDYLLPAAKSVLDLIGKVADLVGDVWHNVLAPFLSWFSTYILPTIAPIIEAIGSTILSVFGAIGKIVQGIMDIFSGVIDFLDGVFTLNWQKCLDGLVEILKGVIELIWGAVKGIVGLIIAVVSGFADEVIILMKACYDNICKAFSNIAEWFTDVFNKAWKGITEAFSKVGEWFSDRWNDICNAFKDTEKWFSEKFTSAQKGIKKAFDNTVDFFKKIHDGICDAFDSIGQWFSDKFTLAERGVRRAFDNTVDFFDKIWTGIQDTFARFDDWLQNIFNTDFSNSFGILGDIMNGFLANVGNIYDDIKQIFGGLIDFITGVFTSNWEQAWNGVVDTFSGVFSLIADIAKSPINMVIGFINGMLDGVESSINWIADRVNTLSFDVPDWVPGIGGSHFGFDLPGVDFGRVPYLAQGGYVKANTPQLAMIGDNRHQGEVVAPEDKLKAMALEAAQLSDNGSDEVVALLKEILKAIKRIDPDIQLDGMSLKKYIVDKINKNTKATGKCEIIT